MLRTDHFITWQLLSAQNEDKFLPAFRRSIGYVKLLAELDLLKESWSRSDDDDLDYPVSADEISLSDNISLSSLDAIDATQGKLM